MLNNLLNLDTLTGMKGRAPDITAAISSQEIAVNIQRLTRYLRVWNEAKQASESDGYIAAFNVKSGLDGLVAFGKLTNFLEESLDRVHSGNPVRPGELKERSVKKKRGLPSIPEGKAALTAHRNKRIKKS